MNRLAAYTIAAMALTSCERTMYSPSSAAAHECDTLRLQPGTSAYNDCVDRMISEERALHRAQKRTY